MTSAGDKAILLAEINNDPESLGYAGKTNAEIAAIMNTPGTASEANRVPIASDTPVIKLGSELMAVVVAIDGLVSPLNTEGAGVAAALAWIENDTDPYAVSARYFFAAAASIDVTNVDVRNTIDYLRGVEVGTGAPPRPTLISEAAMNALLALGMVLMSRAREILSRPVTETDIAETLA